LYVMECGQYRWFCPLRCLSANWVRALPVGSIKISEWATKSAQCPVLSMLQYRMVFMICAMGMWDFEWWLEQLDPRRLVPCKGTKRGRKQNMKTLPTTYQSLSFAKIFNNSFFLKFGRVWCVCVCVCVCTDLCNTHVWVHGHLLCQN
jgi:hypothetical protein